MASHRLFAVKSLREFRQFPFWNPYGCGGHPSWAGVESGTIVVSPFLPLYFLTSVPVALRLEIVGTVLLSAVGSWLLAGRFTKSSAAKAFVCAVYVVNGRWALQAATGHAWHLYYAWVPWVLFFYDRACSNDGTSRRPAFGDVTRGAVVMAMMVYSGAIYPLPHSVMAIAVYGGVLALLQRRIAPVSHALVMGIVAFGLSAPKLVPMLETLRRYPRLVASTEVIDLRILLHALTARGQIPGRPIVPVPQWGWHEYGIYVGWLALVSLIIGVVAARGTREHALKWALAALLLLGFGSFHALAPWTLLHEYLPVFKSQHVPSRWHYPAVLLGAVLAASAAERLLQTYPRRRLLLELMTLLIAGVVAIDVAIEAQAPLRSAFWMDLRRVPTLGAPFHQLRRAPRELRYQRDDYAPPAVPAILASVGVIECGSFPGLNVWAKNEKGVIVGLGAKGRGERGYRGETYLESGIGEAEVTAFSPNAVVVRVRGAQPSDLLVLNQNYDPGWRANGEATVSLADTVAVRVRQPNETVEFRYRPPTWWPSLLTFAMTVVALLSWTSIRARLTR
jgi:hypothetical protein